MQTAERLTRECSPLYGQRNMLLLVNHAISAWRHNGLFFQSPRGRRGVSASPPD